MNRDEYDAALKRGIELGLEAAVKACGSVNVWTHGHLPIDVIQHLDPETIAREAQDMGSGKET